MYCIDFSHESRQRQEEVSRKAEHLNQRRERLRTLLTHEQEELARELQEFRVRSSRDTTSRADAMVTLLELRRREEEARRREAELRLYQQWQRGQPVLQEVLILSNTNKSMPLGLRCRIH